MKFIDIEPFKGLGKIYLLDSDREENYIFILTNLISANKVDLENGEQ